MIENIKNALAHFWELTPSGAIFIAAFFVLVGIIIGTTI